MFNIRMHWCVCPDGNSVRSGSQKTAKKDKKGKKGQKNSKQSSSNDDEEMGGFTVDQAW